MNYTYSKIIIIRFLKNKNDILIDISHHKSKLNLNNYMNLFQNSNP